MKKKITKEPTQNAVMFRGQKYSVVARSITSIRIARPGEEIIVPITAVTEVTNEVSRNESMEEDQADGIEA